MPYSNYMFAGADLLRPSDNRPVAFGLNDDQAVGLLVRYTGSQESGTVEVAVTTGDITFKVGALGAEAADTAVGLPTKNGIYDVSNAAADTFDEIVADINASGTWQAVLVDIPGGLSSNAALVTKSATQAKTPKGVQLLTDTSQIFYTGRLIAPDVFRSDIRVHDVDYEFLQKGSGVKKVADGNVYKNTRGVLVRARAVSTYATGTSQLRVYSNNQIVWQEDGGATTAEKKFDFSQDPVYSAASGEVLRVVLFNSAAMSSSGLHGQGALIRA